MGTGIHIRMVLALGLGLAMQLCCCQLRGLTGLCASRAAAPVLQAEACAGCCCERDAGEPTPGEHEPPRECDGGPCCIKGLTPGIEWAPDVDEIGVSAGADAAESAVANGDRDAPSHRMIAMAWRPPPVARTAVLRQKCALLI